MPSSISSCSLAGCLARFACGCPWAEAARGATGSIRLLEGVTHRPDHLIPRGTRGQSARGFTLYEWPREDGGREAARQRRGSGATRAVWGEGEQRERHSLSQQPKQAEAPTPVEPAAASSSAQMISQRHEPSSPIVPPCQETSWLGVSSGKARYFRRRELPSPSPLLEHQAC